MGQKSITPLHVGEYLAELIKERRVTSNQLAKAINLSQNLITCLLTGEQILTADVAIVLGDFFGTSPLFWLDLQRSHYLAARDVKQEGMLMTA